MAGSGAGPGEGTVKRILPDSHADFIFAVAAEEFGIVLCLIVVGLFAFIVIRALDPRALRADDPFVRYAASGLAILFGTQSAINMSVNLHLIPAKGNDTAVHLLWRLVAAVARLRDGHGAGADPRTAAGRAVRPAVALLVAAPA